MICPDYANAYSGLDANTRPVMTFGELLRFLEEARVGHVSPTAVHLALEDMCANGTVWRVLRAGKMPLYALCRRIEFRSKMRRMGCPSTYD